jgi:NADPH2:quinone reductase
MHGSVAVYASGGSDLQLPVRPSMVPNARWQFVLVYNAPDDWRARALDDVSAAVADGAARVGAEAGLPLHHYGLERTADAHAAVEGGAVGKVLVDVAE